MATPVLKLADFGKICRICLQIKKEMKPLFEDLIPTMFETCTSVKVLQNDDLPKILCVQCVHQLSRAFTFRQMVEKSDTVLKNFLMEMQTQEMLTNLEADDIVVSPDIEKESNDAETLQQHSMADYKCEKSENQTYSQLPDVEEEEAKVNDQPKDAETDDETFLELATFQASQSMVPGRCVCNLCHKEFKNTKWLKSHMALHANWIKANCKKMLRCKMCQRAFKGPGMLKMHMRTHEEKLQTTPTCTVCGRTFPTKAMLYRHRQTHFEKKTYPCTICSKSFVSNYALQSHMARHRGERRFSCLACGKSFYNSTDLKVHMRLHTGEKPLKCNECGKAFRRHSTLCQHVKKHRGVRTHTCETCNRSFFELSKLAAHRRVHTGEKPFACEVCGRRFAQQSALVYHRRTHTGERPYACIICHMRFTTSSARNNHMLIHGSNARKLIKGGELVKHNKGLSKEKRRLQAAESAQEEEVTVEVTNEEAQTTNIYICATCNKSYTEVSQWKKHMKKHETSSHKADDEEPQESEEKMMTVVTLPIQSQETVNVAATVSEPQYVEVQKTRYPCNRCKKHYAHLTTLEKHLKSHHNAVIITEEQHEIQYQTKQLHEQQQQQQQHHQHQQQPQLQQIQVAQIHHQGQPQLQLQHGAILQPQIHLQHVQQPQQQLVQQPQIAVSTVQTLQVQQQQQQHQTVAVQAQQLLQPVQVQAIQLSGQPGHHQHPLQLAVQQQMHVAQSNCHMPSIVQVPASMVNSLQQQQLEIGSNITHRIILQPQHMQQPHTTTVYLQHH